MMAATNIWTSGPDPEVHALARARELGYKDPRVARTVLIHGTHASLVAVIVADGEAEAEQHREPQRRKGA